MLEIYDAIFQMQRDLHLLGSEIRQLHVILSRFQVFREPARYKSTGHDEKDTRNFGNAVWNCHSTNFDDSYIYDRIYRWYPGAKDRKNLSISRIASYWMQKSYLNLSKLADICSHIFPSYRISLYRISDALLYFYAVFECTDEFIERNRIPRSLSYRTRSAN